MFDFFRRLFATDFMPHVLCLREPALVWLQAVSDSLIALSYFLIPALLLVLVRRRRDMAFRWAYVLFGVFILACGSTHLLGVVTLWHPVYRLEGVVKALTAVASLGTAVLMVRIVPEALTLTGPEELRHEIKQRRSAEERIKQLNAELENRVHERTMQLEAANAQLREFAATLDKAQVIVQKLDGTVLFWNSGAEALYGFTREEAVGRLSQELLKSEFPEPLNEIQSELMRNNTWAGEFTQRCRNGSVICVASSWSLHRNEAGEPVSVVKVNNDITALKRASEALRISEATSRSLFENAGQGILTADLAGRIVDVNAMTPELFQYNRDELIGMPVEMLLPDGLQGRHMGNVAQFTQNHPHARRPAQAMELMARRADGSVFPVEISLSNVDEHQTGLVMAFISDVTARKQAGQERENLIAMLKGALSEKTVLLKEVHHRVKNNLAVISALLGMQANGLEDERARIALGESQQRVLSMALIHEYLYANERLDRVNFGEYVKNLAHDLCATYAIEPGLIDIGIDAEEIELSVHRAIPCGLILNELLSNALKYAFPAGRRGEISIRFTRLESGELLLACQDNGVGLAKSFDWRNPTSLGLRIVSVLAKQIDGSLSLESGGSGTCFALKFPADAADTPARPAPAPETIGFIS